MTAPAPGMPPGTVLAHIPASMAKSTSKETSRYAIAGVQITRLTPKRALACATNGKMLAVSEVPAAFGEGTPRKLLAPVGVLKDAKHGPARITFNGTEWRNMERQIIGDPIEGVFPPLGEIMPELDKPMTIGALRALLADTERFGDEEPVRPEWMGHREIGLSAELLHKLAGSISDEGNVSLFIKSPNRPVVVVSTYTNGLSGVGVLMPLNSEKSGAREVYDLYRGWLTTAEKGEDLVEAEDEAEEAPEADEALEHAMDEDEPADAPAAAPVVRQVSEFTTDEELAAFAVMPPDGKLAERRKIVERDLAAERASETPDPERLKRLLAEWAQLDIWEARRASGPVDQSTLCFEEFSEFVTFLEDGTPVLVAYEPRRGNFPPHYTFHGAISATGYCSDFVQDSTAGCDFATFTKERAQGHRDEFVAERVKRVKKRRKVKEGPPVVVVPPDTTEAALRQYARFKAKHPDCVLLFRIGDFYEAYREDAEIVAKVCGVQTLSIKGVTTVGLKYDRIEERLRVLIQAGHRVAVCEKVQTDGQPDPKRTVTRIITPGTLQDAAADVIPLGQGRTTDPEAMAKLRDLAELVAA